MTGPTRRQLMQMADEVGIRDYAAAARLVRLALAAFRPVPAPVPVSARLPGPEDCLDEGWAWFFNPRTGWRRATQPVHSGYTHWLPATALPLPSGGGGGMTTPLRPPLSPAAQAVLSAFLGATPTPGVQELAAALRAAADRVVPDEQRPPRRGVRPGGTGALTPEEGAEDQRAATRRHLIRIATELGAATIQ
jgi:hypothetical protein